MRIRVKKTKKCLNCGKLFNPWNYLRSKYCSYVCSIKDRKRICKGKYFKCEHCGKQTYRKPSHIKISKHKACSYACGAKLRIRGKMLVCKVCKKHYYRPISQINLRGSSFCSRKCGGIFASTKTGKKSPNWKGGLSSISKRLRSGSKWKLWREAVFERDNYTCQECGLRSGNGKTVVIEPHHIKPFAYFPELRFDISNGKTLCHSCHQKTKLSFREMEKLYGKNQKS